MKTTIDTEIERHDDTPALSREGQAEPVGCLLGSSRTMSATSDALSTGEFRFAGGTATFREARRAC